jgi:WD40 repeat protein
MPRCSGRLSLAAAASALLFLGVQPGAGAVEFVRGPMLRAGGDNVNTVAFSRDGRLLATGHNSEVARLWSLPDGKEVATLKGHTASVLSVAFNPDATVLATAGEDKTARLWSVPEGKPITTLRGTSGNVNAIAFWPTVRCSPPGAR